MLRDEFLRQLEADSEFLRRNNIMDYSLLVGVHQAGAPTHPSRRLNPHLLPVSTETEVLDGGAEQQDAGAALATAAAQVCVCFPVAFFCVRYALLYVCVLFGCWCLLSTRLH